MELPLQPLQKVFKGLQSTIRNYLRKNLLKIRFRIFARESFLLNSLLTLIWVGGGGGEFYPPPLLVFP